jgi:N,N'-diacetylchitobiose transport system permease protein
VSSVSAAPAPRRRRRGRLRRRAWDLLGLALFLVLVFPVFWMISTAFKPEDEINSADAHLVPASPTLDHFRDAMARPYFWDTVQNSLIVVCVAVVASIVLAFLAAVALAKYRFTGSKVFVVLMIGILMLPPVGLVIPLYVVLARYHLTNTLTGVILTYLTFTLPFAVLTLRGFILGIPKELEEAAMVDGSSRLGAFVRILLPARRAGPRRDVRLRVHHGLERVHLRERDPHRPGEPHHHGLALVLPRDEPERRLGRADGRVDADGDPRDRVLPARPAAHRVRAHLRRGQGVSRVAAPRPCRRHPRRRRGG